MLAFGGCDCGGGDDPSGMGADGGRTDSGSDAAPPDRDSGGGIDAGADGGARDAGSVDAGPPDAAAADAGPPLPPCGTDPGGSLVVAPGFRIDTVAEGDPLVEPLGMTLGLDDRIYVANSHSLFVSAADAGEIFRVDPDGTVTPFVTDMRLRGPMWVAFAPGGAAGGPGIAYVGTEDVDEALLHPSDWLLIHDGATTVVGPSTSENNRVAFGPGGAFGTDLWITGRERTDTATPNPYRLLRWDPAGSAAPAVVPITDGATATRLGGIGSFAWANGGTLGTDLYVSTFVDAPGFTPGSEAAVWRVSPALEATRLTTGTFAADLAASPDPAGPWGDFLYATGDLSGEGRVRRIDAAGVEMDVVSGLDSAFGLLFAPDGSLWVSDPRARRISRITHCRP